MIGQTISHYRILEKLGEGGMGVVYKAEDTKLERTVALKFLAAHLLNDEEVKQRFLREAKSAAALHHPNICTVYEIDEAEGKTFLAMAFLEGTSLEDRVAEGPLPLKDVLEIGRQVAEGLAAAHAKGIVHRDIKPANILVSPEGRATIMDFGLARLTEASRLTKAEQTVGTAAYMSPEQIQGDEVDPRTDIWALGCVLYEMVAGVRPFKGQYDQALLYEIVQEEPEPLTALRAGVPMELEWIVSKCLAKESTRRYQSSTELLVDLGTLADKMKSGKSTIVSTPRRVPGTAIEGTGRPAGSKGGSSASSQRFRWAIAGVAGVVLAALWFSSGNLRPSSGFEVAPLRLEVVFPDGLSYTSRFALSPDGRWLVLLQDGRRLVLHDFLDRSTRDVAEADLQCYPFWSPDSRFFGFAADRDLKRFDLDSGVVQTISRLPGTTFRGGSWSSDGAIVIGIEDPETAGIYQIPASGGEPMLLPHADESSPIGRHEYWPDFLPEGRHFVFWRRSDRTAYIGSLDSAQRQPLFKADSSVRYAHPGYLIYVRENTLETRAFNGVAPGSIGEPVAIADEVRSPAATGRSNFTVSASGHLVMTSPGAFQSQLAWIDRQGQGKARVGQPEEYRNFRGLSDLRLSPRGDEVAVPRLASGVWTLSAVTGAGRPLSAGIGQYLDQRTPVWSPDGTRIVLADRDRVMHEKHLFRGASDALRSLGVTGWPSDWSPDGSAILFEQGKDLWLLPLAGDGQAKPIWKTGFAEELPRFSPDGKWIAYVSDESGRREIYIRSLAGFENPEAGLSTMVSTNGGDRPVWKDDGSELFYIREDGVLIAVPVMLGNRIEVGPSEELFDVGGNSQYDTRDGQLFLVQSRQEDAAWLSMVVNWPALVRR